MSPPRQCQQIHYSGGNSSTPAIEVLKDWGTFEITPYAEPDGLIQLDIQPKLNSSPDSVKTAKVSTPPITTSGKPLVTVTVRNRQTIVVGGLIEKTKTWAGIPLLRDIPGLGTLFGRSLAHPLRNEVVVLIRATLLPSEELAALQTPAVITRGVTDATANAALPHP